jgi:predicted metal-dependent peptidase
MSQSHLAQAFSVVKGILQHLCAASQLTVHLIGCDTVASYVGQIRSAHQLHNLELPRGGGTDLRVGFELAVKKIAPRCLVVLTDGDTPWPSRPPHFDTVVVLIGANGKKKAPSWATSIDYQEAKR